MNTFQITLQFLISGVIVVGAILISKSYDSKWAGLLVALPIMTVLGFIFISISANEAVTQRYLLSAILFMIPAAVYLLSLYLLYGKVNLTTNFFVSMVPFAAAVFIIQKFI